MLATMDTGSGNLYYLNEVFFIINFLAMGGLDYTVTMESITLTPAEPLQCIDVNIMDDSVFEESETFTVSISSAPADVTPANAMTTINIMDNER